MDRQGHNQNSKNNTFLVFKNLSVVAAISITKFKWFCTEVSRKRSRRNCSSSNYLFQ